MCDRPAPLHQLVLDAFAQSVIDKSAANVTEVLVADNGKWEVSATEEELGDEPSSDDDPAFAARFPAAPARLDLNQAAMSLGRGFIPATAAQKSAPKKASAAAQAPSAAVPAARQPPQAAQAAPAGAAREKSRSPKRAKKRAGQAKEEAAPAAPVPAEDKMLVWEKLQGLRKEEEKEETRFGWLPGGVQCSRCEKAVVERGGVYCGRKRPKGADVPFGGCFKAICWKCMNKASKAELGGIKTSKSEFASLGDDAWWMHGSCMTPEDKRAYFGEEDEDVGKPKDMDEDDDDDKPGKFAWE